MSFQTLTYNQSLALMTDLYQLTMAYGYWQEEMASQEAAFHLFFRKNPFGGGYSIACGLAYVIDYLKNFTFNQTDLDYLASLLGNDGKPLFHRDFLKYLSKMEFTCHVDAIPEGNIVFPHEPLIRVVGPIIQCQVIETVLLNIVNFQTLIATKAARVCHAAQGPVLEFGLRRAQGMDGALAASRAAYIGGAAATSNVFAGKVFGIPVKGTHAHSWIMCFEEELEAFQAYAEAMPNNCIFLVDTYDTLEGVRRSVKVGQELRHKGYEMVGIRLDSGDLAYLSIESRKILDESGFPDAKIVASNDLDERIIASLREQGAKIDIWGVGTKLITAYDQPALGGVYKLAAIREPGGEWQYRIKLSEQSIKVSTPGLQQVRRFYDHQENLADMIFDVSQPEPESFVMVDPLDMTRQKRFAADTKYNDLLAPIFKDGQILYDSPDVHDLRAFTQKNLVRFHAGIKRFEYPHQYPVGIEKSLFERKTSLVFQARNVKR